MQLEHLLGGQLMLGPKAVGLTVAIFPNGNDHKKVSFDQAYLNFQNMLTADPEEVNNQVNTVNANIRNHCHGSNGEIDEELYNQYKIALRSQSERLECAKIKRIAATKFAHEFYTYSSNELPNDYNNRYLTAFCMKKNMPLRPADKLYNERMSYLIGRAEAGMYKYLEDRKPVPPEPTDANYQSKYEEYNEKLINYETLLREKNQLEQYHVDMFNKLKKLDVNKLLNREYTDKELAEQCVEIYEAAHFTGEMQNAIDATKKWFGVNNSILKNPEISNIIDTYGPLTDILAEYEQRLSVIMSPTYEYIDPIKNTRGLEFLDGQDIIPNTHLITNAISECENVKIAKNVINFGIIKSVFKKAGLSDTNLRNLHYLDNSVVPPATGVLTEDYIKQNKNSLITVFPPGNEDIKMSFLPKDLPSVLKGLTEGKSIEEIFPNLTPEQAPKPVGWFGRVTDWFNDKLFGTKPNQEAYEEALSDYNNRLLLCRKAQQFKTSADIFKQNDALVTAERERLEREEVLSKERDRQNPQAPEFVENVDDNVKEESKQISNDNAFMDDLDNLEQQLKEQQEQLEKEQNINKEDKKEDIKEEEKKEDIKEEEKKEDIKKEESEFDINMDEINNLYDKIQKESGIKMSTTTKVDDGFEHFQQVFSDSLKYAKSLGNWTNIGKNVAGLLILGKLNKKIEDSVLEGEGNFNKVYDEVNNQLNQVTLDKQAKELASKAGFSDYVKNMDSDTINKLTNPETSLKAGALEFKRFALTNKAIEDAKIEKETFKQNQAENNNLNKDNVPVRKDEDNKHLGNNSSINLSK